MQTDMPHPLLYFQNLTGTLLTRSSIVGKQALMVFKALTNQAPTYLIDMFEPPCTNTHHGLRSKTSNKLYVPKAHRKSFRYKKVWNSLNDNTREAKSISQFKSEYTAFQNI